MSDHDVTTRSAHRRRRAGWAPVVAVLAGKAAVIAVVVHLSARAAVSLGLVHLVLALLVLGGAGAGALVHRSRRGPDERS